LPAKWLSESFVVCLSEALCRLPAPEPPFDILQLQRISIAWALLTNTTLLIADEPVSMDDASLRMSIGNLFKKLRDELGVSILYITYDLATA
jgi:ABC-type oligopeptide transport system ATPase subunit